MTITKQTLAKMLADHRHVDILPPLQGLKAKQQAKQEASGGRGCRPCQRARAGLTDNDFDTGLRSLANYLADKPALSKQVAGLLGGNELRIKYRKASGGFVVWKS